MKIQYVILGTITGFMLAVNALLIAQTIVYHIETNQASLLPLLYISLILVAVFAIIKAIYKIKDKIAFPIDVGYLVGINAFFGLYLLSQIKSGFSFMSLINPQYFPALHLGFAQFIMAAILWKKSRWPWYAALGLGIIQIWHLSGPLLESNNPVFAVPLVITFVLVLMLTESKITQFYQIDAPEFLKYFSKFSETGSKDD